EEPSGVRPMPLGRTHVGHGLHDLVLGGERGRERLRGVAHAAIPIVQRVAIGRAGEGGHRSARPKQAATQAALRTGANHSTTEIIGVTLSQSKTMSTCCSPNKFGTRYPDGCGHQPRSTHSCRCGDSVSIVVSRPWPGSTRVAPGSVNKRRSTDLMIVGKSPP